jgi:hypothetical protein
MTIQHGLLYSGIKVIVCLKHLESSLSEVLPIKENSSST